MGNEADLLPHQPISVQEVDTAIRNIGHKATGTDGLSSRILKDTDNRELLNGKLSQVFSTWLSNRIYPEYLVEAKVVPLSKEPTPYPSFGQIRTISILPIVSKVYEKILLKRLQ